MSLSRPRLDDPLLAFSTTNTSFDSVPASTTRRISDEFLYNPLLHLRPHPVISNPRRFLGSASHSLIRRRTEPTLHGVDDVWPFAYTYSFDTRKIISDESCCRCNTPRPCQYLLRSSVELYFTWRSYPRRYAKAIPMTSLDQPEGGIL